MPRKEEVTPPESKPTLEQTTELKSPVTTVAKETVAVEEAKPFPTPPVMSSTDAKIDEEVILSLRKTKRKRELKDEIDPEPEESATVEEVPAALPKAMFFIGSQFISCPKFQLSDKEAEVFAESLNEIFKYLGVELSGIIIHTMIALAIVLMKVVACREAIAKTMAKYKQKQATGANMAYDERTQSMKPVS